MLTHKVLRKMAEYHAVFGLCGVYIKKLVRCALFACDILTVYPILKGRGAYTKKLSSSAPHITKKRIWRGNFSLYTPIQRKEPNFHSFRSLCGALGGDFFIYAPYIAPAV